MNTIKKIMILILFAYAPCAFGMFRAVQESTLDALELYQNVENVSDEKEQSISDKEVEEDGWNDQPPKLEEDPEQYFVDKKDVQLRIAAHEILEYTLDQILDRAREYPGYYGDSDKEEITQWYEEAQNNTGYQKEILDRIKDDAKKHSLEQILEYAQKNSLYKGFLSYQKIVDSYYQIYPEKIVVAQQAFVKATQFLHLDDHDNDELYEKDLKKFLMEYKKLPTSLQETIQIKTLYGVPYIDGRRIQSAKVLVDFLIAHESVYEDLKDVILLLKA